MRKLLVPSYMVPFRHSVQPVPARMEAYLPAFPAQNLEDTPVVLVAETPAVLVANILAALARERDLVHKGRVQRRQEVATY